MEAVNLHIPFRPVVKEDYPMLKRCIVGWNKYANVKKTYITGEFTQAEVKSIIEILDTLKDEIDVDIIGMINPHKEGTRRVFYQTVEFYKKHSEPFIQAHDDLIPIKPLCYESFNKEYKILRKDYRKFPANELGWFIEKQVDSIKWFCDRYNKETLPLYEGHSLYLYDNEIMQFILDNPETHSFSLDDILRGYLHCEKGLSTDDIFYPNLVGNCWFANKWQIDKNKLKDCKAINFTLPMHPKTKALLKKVTTLKL